MADSVLRCVCGGAKIHHENDEDGRCWCPTCISGTFEDRCVDWRPVAVEKPVKRNVTRTGHAHPETSHHAAEIVLPRTGTLRHTLYRAILQATSTPKRGMTDGDLEDLTGRKHESVSASRNTLMNDGLIRDSGLRRLTDSGSTAIVWEAAVDR